MVIREDSTCSDPEPGHSIVIHFQGQGHHVEVWDWEGGLGAEAEWDTGAPPSKKCHQTLVVVMSGTL